MVDISTRIFHETDKGMIGAEVIVYDDTGNKVKSIQVTDQTQFDKLVEQLKVLDETYVKENQLYGILANTQGEINQINATLLEGYKASDFSLSGHQHDGRYALINHATNNPSKDNFIGTERLFGHVKTINNVSQGSYRDGEALSAFQGKVLNDRINNLTPYTNDSGWINLQFSSNGNTFYSNWQTVQYRKIGKIVHIRGVVKNKSKTDGDTDGWELAVLPVGFRPSMIERQVNHGSSGAKHLVYVEPNGQLCIGARYTKNGSLIETPKDAWLNVYITYFVD